MTGQTPPRTAAFTATVRVHLLHAPDPDTEPNPDLESAQARWRAVNAPHLVALVRAGAPFKKGKLVERPAESATDEQAA